LNLFINQYCKVNTNHAEGNNFRQEAGNLDYLRFMKHLYQALSLDYPKFFKMDNLSKLGFISSEILLQSFDLSAFEKEKIGVVIANSNSCNDTDSEFYDTIKDPAEYFPSPALFVYTLPNIMIGEICIKNKILGENGFFISKSFDHKFIIDYVRNLFDTGAVTCCIVGWVDYRKDDYSSFLCLVTAERNELSVPFIEEETRNLHS
jgi:hypothetical protein